MVAYAGLFAVALWFVFLRGDGVPSEIRGHEITKFDDTGVQDHAPPGETVTYAESPPVAGRHGGTLAPCGTYAQPVPSENVLHSFEHGAVALLYAPDAPIEDIRTLESIVAESENNVLSAPYEGEMETPFAIASWGERMDLEEMDEAAVREYVEVLGGEGPEGGAEPCEKDQDEEFEPPAPEATGAPDPAPSATAEPGATPDADQTAKPNKGKTSKPTPKPTESS